MISLTDTVIYFHWFYDELFFPIAGNSKLPTWILKLRKKKENQYRPFWVASKRRYIGILSYICQQNRHIIDECTNTKSFFFIVKLVQSIICNIDMYYLNLLASENKIVELLHNFFRCFLHIHKADYLDRIRTNSIYIHFVWH